MHYAVRCGAAMVRTLLREGADADVADDKGVTPLHAAATLGLDDVVKLLLSHEKRLNVNVQDDRGKTPLHYAATWRNLSTVGLLLLGGADPNIKDNSGKTPLHEVLSKAEPPIELVKTLLKAGADPNATTDEGRTPLHYAALHDNPRLISLLLKYGANPTIKDNYGKTPLDYAKERGKMKAAEAMSAGSTRHRKPENLHV
jgi:ankyrin repeat protein